MPALWQPGAERLLQRRTRLRRTAEFATTPVTSADAGGATGSVNIWQPFSQAGSYVGGAATETWTVISAPTAAEYTAGTVIANGGTLNFLPVTAGTWVLRYTASNSGGTATSDLTLTVNSTTAGATGADVLIVVGDRTKPVDTENTLVQHLVNGGTHNVVAVRTDTDTTWAGAFDCVWMFDSAHSNLLSPKYKDVPLLWGNGGGVAESAYHNVNTAGVITLATETQYNVTSAAPNGGYSGPVNVFNGPNTSAAVPFSSGAPVIGDWAQVLATLDSDAEVPFAFRYEKNALLADNSTVAGARRLVHVLNPTGIGNLTSDGFALIDSWLEWLAEPAVPAVYVGIRPADLAQSHPFGTTGTALSMTASDSSSNTITSRAWTIQSGPDAVGSTLSTGQALSWTPTVAGDYVLRYTATDSVGTGYQDLPVTVAQASPTPPSYRYYRFKPTAIGSGTVFQISEFEFYNGFTKVSTAGATISATGNTNGAGEDPAKAFDGLLSTKWCDTSYVSGTTTLVCDFGVGNATTVTGYRFATANDAPTRDPVTWTVEGSPDNSTWTVLSTVSGYSPTTVRQVYVGGWQATVPFEYATVTAAGTGSAAISSTLDTDLPVAPDVSAAGAGAASTTGALVTETTSFTVSAAGTAAVSGFDTIPPGTLTATGRGGVATAVEVTTAGVGAASLDGFVIVLPDVFTVAVAGTAGVSESNQNASETAAGAGTATISGQLGRAESAAGTGTAAISSTQHSTFGLLTPAGLGSVLDLGIDKVFPTGSVTADGQGSAALSGVPTSSTLRPAGVGTGSVAGSLIIIASPVTAAGLGAATLASVPTTGQAIVAATGAATSHIGSFVTVKATVLAAGVGIADTQPRGTAIAAGCGVAHLTPVYIAPVLTGLGTSTLTSNGVSQSAVVSVITTAVLTLNGVSTATLLVVPPACAALAAEVLATSHLTTNGVSAATVVQH